MLYPDDNNDPFNSPYSHDMSMDEYYQDAEWTGFVYPSATWNELEAATQMINLRQEPHRNAVSTPEDWLDTWVFIRDLKTRRN